MNVTVTNVNHLFKSHRDIRRERRYAKTHGYFWMPCSICGEPFGGHERPNGTLLRNSTSTELTCPDCPGYWALRDGCYYELVICGDASDPHIIWTSGSTAWKNPNPTLL